MIYLFSRGARSCLMRTATEQKLIEANFDKAFQRLLAGALFLATITAVIVLVVLLAMTTLPHFA